MAPADGTLALSIMLTRRVAQASVILLFGRASQWSASRTSVRVFCTRDANIGHAAGTVRRAHTAVDVVEILTTLRVPKVAPLLAIVALGNGASSTTVAIRFVAKGSIVTELIGTVLPADWTDTIVAIAAQRVAKLSIFLFVCRAGRDRDANSAPIGQNPACFSI